MTTTKASTSSTPKAESEKSDKPATTPRKKHTIADLTTTDVIDQETSESRALGAQTAELVASVGEKNGYVVLEVQNKGMIGVEPVALRADSLSELRDLLDDLDAQADKRIRERK